MNEELQNALAAMILQFTEALGGASDFALEQAPEVIQQLLLWKSAISGIMFALGVVLIACAALAARTRIKWMPPQREPITDEVTRWLAELATHPSFEISYHAKELAGGLKKSWQRIPRSEPPDYLVLVAIACGIIGFGIAGVNIDWFQIMLAPKVYLIEYAASLAK